MASWCVSFTPPSAASSTPAHSPSAATGGALGLSGGETVWLPLCRTCRLLLCGVGHAHTRLNGQQKSLIFDCGSEIATMHRRHTLNVSPTYNKWHRCVAPPRKRRGVAHTRTIRHAGIRPVPLHLTPNILSIYVKYKHVHNSTETKQAHCKTFQFTRTKLVFWEE